MICLQNLYAFSPCLLLFPVKLIQSNFYFRYFTFHVCNLCERVKKYSLHLTLKTPHLPVHYSILFPKSLNIFIVAALKFLSAHLNICVILGSISTNCIFFLIMHHIFLLNHMSIKFWFYSSHWGWYILGNLDYNIFL